MGCYLTPLLTPLLGQTGTARLTPLKVLQEHPIFNSVVNGLIVRYRVEYTANSRTQSTEEATDDPRSGAQTTLTGLTPFTNYSIRVAGVNEEGDIGVYSDPITEQTEESSELFIFIIKPHPMSSFSSSWSSGNHSRSLSHDNNHNLGEASHAKWNHH